MTDARKIISQATFVNSKAIDLWEAQAVEGEKYRSMGLRDEGLAVIYILKDGTYDDFVVTWEELDGYLSRWVYYPRHPSKT